MKKFILILAVISFAACTNINHNQKDSTMSNTTEPQAAKSNIHKAVCELYPTQGSAVQGTVTFTQTDSGMVIIADITGLTPGRHGFHIHEFGDCSAPDGTSAGGHFNPGHEQHGGPMAMEHHEGDMGNITANEQGIAHLQMLDKTMSFEGTGSIIGRGIIVHAGEDDLTTQPTGNSGARVACGTIGVAK